MTILVTGASGFVGSRLVDRLCRELGSDARLIGWDRAPSPEAHAARGIEWRSVDLTDAAAGDAAVRADPPSRVFHLAGLSSVKQAEGTAMATYEVNASGTEHLARALGTHAPGAVTIFASTGTVYGSAFAMGDALGETAPVRPLDAYA